MTWEGDLEQVRGMFRTATVTAAAAGSGATEGESKIIHEMAANRAVNRRTAAAGTGAGGLSLATGRPTDPLFYWRNANLPYNIWEGQELMKVRAFCRLLYILHPVIGSCVDIFSKYPLQGMEIVCPKDSKIEEFYSDLFLDQLDYEDFLIDVGREYWTVGEAWPFGTFNELLGVWEDDELLQPDDIKVIHSPFLREPRFEMRIPSHIRKILIERKPEWEYRQLIQAYPEMASMAALGDIVDEDDSRAWMPVANSLLTQLKFKGDTFHDRGVPILMRAFRSVMQEEMLNAAQDAIASRLYTPLILARLGASATDLGTSVPWIPTAGDLDNFNDALNAALAADFRVMVHHFAVDMESVFGRENIPNLDADFERITEKILQTFGLSKTMLSGASGGETYAADALNRDLISQLLTTYQKRLKRFFRKRAEVVAEAQGHYDFEIKGGRPIPIMEEVIEQDKETGEQRIIERPKLLVPELKIAAMNMRDEDTQRQYIEALRASGVPISMKTRMVNVPVDLKNEYEATKNEQVEQAVQAQLARRETFLALRSQGLPIPDDLRADFEPRVMKPAQDAHPAQSGEVGPPGETSGGGDGEDVPDPQVLDTLGLTQPADTAALAPTPDDLALGLQDGEGNDVGGDDGGETPSNVLQALPRNRLLRSLETPGRPPESDEQRAHMPRAASLSSDSIEDGDEEVPQAGMRGPRHVGIRRVEAFYLDPEREETPV